MTTAQTGNAQKVADQVELIPNAKFVGGHNPFVRHSYLSVLLCPVATLPDRIAEDFSAHATAK